MNMWASGFSVSRGPNCCPRPGNGGVHQVQRGCRRQAWTDTGLPYTVIWVALAAVRLTLIYGTEHWFTRAIGKFLVNNHISVNAFADSIIFVAIAPVIANRLTISS
jgi:hypothetical protein